MSAQNTFLILFPNIWCFDWKELRDFQFQTGRRGKGVKDRDKKAKKPDTLFVSLLTE